MSRRALVCFLLLDLGACAPVGPVGGGAIHTRCSADAGRALAPCAPTQYALCVLGSDAGNAGELFAGCCNSGEEDDVCASHFVRDH